MSEEALLAARRETLTRLMNEHLEHARRGPVTDGAK
jgi:hypothetical protein